MERKKPKTVEGKKREGEREREREGEGEEEDKPPAELLSKYDMVQI
jgi:hypothetical protein